MEKTKEIRQILKTLEAVVSDVIAESRQGVYTPGSQLNAVVRSERAKQKISQGLLAKLAGVSVGTIQAIESGKKSVSFENVQVVLGVLGKKIWIK